MSGRSTLLAASILALCTSAAQADNVADFYRGRQILIIGSDAGSGFDAYARLVGAPPRQAHSRQSDGRAVNKPGAGSLTMTNALVNAGPKDGSAIGAPQSSAPVEDCCISLSKGGASAAKYDATKLNWIGSASQDVFVVFDWHTAKPKSFSDL